MSDAKDKKINQLETELKKANQALVDFEKNLKQTHAAVMQQEKLASIGQLAAGIAHELNNPLGFVSSNFMTLARYLEKLGDLYRLSTEFFKQQASATKAENSKKVEDLVKFTEENDIAFIVEDMADIVVESRQGLDRMAAIVDNMRRFSHIDFAGKVADLDLNEAIENTLVIAKNETKYVAEIDAQFSSIPKIQCKGDEINQVLLNIIVNSAQAIGSQDRKEKGTITVKTFLEDPYVCCEISDDGPGIPKKIINKVFDPFFTTKPPGKGTGLGLNISYDIIVNKHKGELTVDSEEGNGTRFSIKLPIIYEETVEA